MGAVNRFTENVLVKRLVN